jgi:hypothetical protein
MSAPLVRHGWTIAFQPQLFARQYVELKAEVRRLKQELDPQSFVQHPQVKLLAAVMEGIKERILLIPTPAALLSRARCAAMAGSRAWDCRIATACSSAPLKRRVGACC